MSTTTQYMPASATASFDPALVSADTKFNWCQAQTQSCSEICCGDTSTNLCYTDLLTFYCTCTNSTSPDCSRFIQTLPFFMCEATYDQCVNNTGAALQQKCKNNAVCGYEDPASAAQAAIPAGSSVSIGTTTIFGTADASQITTTLATSADSVAPKSGLLSAGAAAGIGVGCTIAAMLLIGILVLLIRRRRAFEKDQLHNTYSGKSDSGGRVSGDVGHLKPELSATSPRHELEGAKTSASVSELWSRTVQRNEDSCE